MSKKIIWLTILIIVVIGVIAAVTYWKRPEKEPIKIGWIGPLTGGAAFVGENAKLAAEFIIQKINKEGGIDDRTIEVIYEDTQSKNSTAVTVAQKLINIDKAKILITVASGETLAVAPITEENKIVLLVTNAANPDIAEAGDYVFRLFPSDKVRGKLYAELIASGNFSRVAFLTEKADFTQGLSKIAKEEYQKLGKNIAIEEFYDSEATDLRTQITKIKNINPDAVFALALDQDKGILAIKQIKEMGIGAELFSTYIVLIPKIVEANKEILEGVTALDISDYIRDNNLINEYKNFHGKEPLYNFFLAVYADTFTLIKNAITKCADDNDCIKEYFYNMDWFDGQLGRFKFDSNGDIIGVGYSKWQVSDGKIHELQRLENLLD